MSGVLPSPLPLSRRFVLRVTLDIDSDLEAAARRRFVIHPPTCEQCELLATAVRMTGISFAAWLGAVEQALAGILIGWDNLYDPYGTPVPFETLVAPAAPPAPYMTDCPPLFPRLRQCLTYGEYVDLVQAITSAGYLGVAQLKSSRSVPASAPALSVAPVEAAATVPVPITPASLGAPAATAPGAPSAAAAGTGT